MKADEMNETERLVYAMTFASRAFTRASLDEARREAEEAVAYLRDPMAREMGHGDIASRMIKALASMQDRYGFGCKPREFYLLHSTYEDAEDAFIVDADGNATFRGVNVVRSGPAGDFLVGLRESGTVAMVYL